MQLFKISVAQVVVAGLLVSSAAGAPLGLSGDIAIRSDFPTVAAPVLYTRKPKSFFKKLGSGLKKVWNKAIKPAANIGLQVAGVDAQLKKRHQARSQFGLQVAGVDAQLKRRGADQSAYEEAPEFLQTRDVDESAEQDEAPNTLEARDFHGKWE
ncbi:hypothetical protein RB594_009625 [Gaeumannomyces avenae]